MRRRPRYVTTVTFWPDRALRDAVDPEFARWAAVESEPLRREIREHERRRREEQRHLHGREHRIPKAMRKEVYRRDAGTCVRCGTLVGWEEWRCHHVIAYPAGPESVENLATLCSDCHEWLHDGFAPSARAAARLEEFRRWWDRRASGA